VSDDLQQAVTAFVMASSLTVLIFLRVSKPRTRLEGRLRELSGKGDRDPDSVGDFARAALPKMGAALVPEKEEERTRLQARLVQAGLYGRQAMYFYLGVKLLLIAGPAVAGLAAALLGLLPVVHALIGGAILGIIGMIGPSFWLDSRKAGRQVSFRRALPDALDVLVICLEGGLSLNAALKRVAGELRTAHPLLASELRIVEREIQLGRSTGDAVRQFGERADLEELRTLASVINQSERFGASLVKALRVHAETLREKRLQHAEEMAQTAGTKILFPTILFIFPGVFIVLLGPAVIQIVQTITGMGK
jgi:tight adherence protein C